MHGPAKKRRPHSRATVFLTVASLASITILLWGIAQPVFEQRPVVTWRMGSDLTEPAQLAEVTTGTPVALELELPFPAFVYVASWSLAMGTIALFPSEHLDNGRENPLPIGTHHLPGLHEGKPMTWPTPNVAGPLHYLVVASRERRPELEEALGRVRQMGHLGRPGHGFEDRGMYVFVPERGLDDNAQRDAPRAADLRAAMTACGDVAALGASGPMRELADARGVFVRPLVLRGH